MEKVAFVPVPETSDKRGSCTVGIASDGVPLSPFEAKPSAAEVVHHDELPKTHAAGSGFGILRSSVSVEGTAFRMRGVRTGML
jgi:hypothetical protein